MSEFFVKVSKAKLARIASELEEIREELEKVKKRLESRDFSTVLKDDVNDYAKN